MREYTPDCPAHNQLCIRSKDNYKAMQHVVAFELAQVDPNIEPYLTHVKTYIDRIDYMKRLFEATTGMNLILKTRPVKRYAF